MNLDSYGTAWYTADGAPVDVEREFGPEWPGHHAEWEAEIVIAE